VTPLFCLGRLLGYSLNRLSQNFQPPRLLAIHIEPFYQHGKPATGNTPIEAVPAGGRFTFRCEFANLTEAELGGLLIAMGMGEPAFTLKFGGGKPAGYGSIAIQLAGIYVHANIVEEYLAWETSTKTLEVKPLVAAALADDTLILRPQLNMLAETLRYTTGRNAPAGNY
jgi:hypothetical protein